MLPSIVGSPTLPQPTGRRNPREAESQPINHPLLWDVEKSLVKEEASLGARDAGRRQKEAAAVSAHRGHCMECRLLPLTSPGFAEVELLLKEHDVLGFAISLFACFLVLRTTELSSLLLQAAEKNLPSSFSSLWH